MTTTRLSVNVNKAEKLHNSRDRALPTGGDAVGGGDDAGAPGITVHPRADQRHITPTDVRDIARLLRGELSARGGRVELNIEGDPRSDLLDLVDDVGPDQCTLVPVVPGEVTS